MSISTTQAVLLQAASTVRPVFSPAEIALGLRTEMFGHEGEKSDSMCEIYGNFAALAANIFGFFRPRFAIDVSRPVGPDCALVKRIIAFFARNAGSKSYKWEQVLPFSIHPLGESQPPAAAQTHFQKMCCQFRTKCSIIMVMFCRRLSTLESAIQGRGDQ